MMAHSPGDTATPGCCGSAPRHSVIECFDRGRHRQRLPELRHVGRKVRGTGDLEASFSVELAGNALSDLRFRTTSCVTLVAYCELLCELARGLTPAAALRLQAGRLIGGLPGVPRAKQDRAMLAIIALHSAIAAAIHSENLLENP